MDDAQKKVLIDELNELIRLRNETLDSYTKHFDGVSARPLKGIIENYQETIEFLSKRIKQLIDAIEN